MTEGPGRSVFAAYILGVVSVGIGAIAVFYVLFTSGYPRFITRALTDPGRAASGNPSTVLLVFASLGLVVLLVSFVIIFGATYGPHPDEGSPDDVDERVERQ